MLDTDLCTPKMTAAWRSHAEPGDIVSFRFPFAEAAAAGRPKARPCLVLEIEEVGGQRLALLAYGTTSRRRSNVGAEIHVRKRGAYLAAGLDEPTRFVGRRLLLVPLEHEGFALCGATGSAILGRLEGAPLHRMQAVRAHLQAERDGAAASRERRARPRRTPWNPARRGVDFTVETRASRRLPRGQARP